MKTYLPPHAFAFRDLFARVEHALRRIGYCRSNSERAAVDWRRFANDLGPDFFKIVTDSKKAETLLAEPPRVMHRSGEWRPTRQLPIADVTELVLRGLCQVRNNIVHGEKFIGENSERSHALVVEAYWILEQIVESNPKVRGFLLSSMGD
jgi:hypothetical protein